MYHDKNKLSAALCIFLHCPVVSSVFTSDILLSALPSKCTSRTSRDQFPNKQKNEEKGDSFYVAISRQQIGRKNTNINLWSWEGVERNTEELPSPNLLQCKLFVYIALNVKGTCAKWATVFNNSGKKEWNHSCAVTTEMCWKITYFVLRQQST